VLETKISTINLLFEHAQDEFLQLLDYVHSKRIFIIKNNTSTPVISHIKLFQTIRRLNISNTKNTKIYHKFNVYSKEHLIN